MPKFSIVIPVYNVEKYIGRALDSVFNQTEKDFEVIVVDDGSTDKSLKIVNKYDVKVIKSKHVGVSESRNLGVAKAKGKYLIFLDSDDFWEKDLLRQVSKSLKNDPDIIRFQVQTTTEDCNITKYEEEPFENLTGERAFEEIVKYHFIENCWCYVYKTEYYKNERFEFKKGTIHEDYGLIPLTIVKAKKVNSIPYIGYNYYRRKGSIMNTPDYEWTKRKVKDFYYHYKNLNKEIEKTNLDSTLFKSYIANSMILKICELKTKEYKEYLRKIKKENIFDNLLTNTFLRKVKKQLLKISPRIYYKFTK